MRVQGVHKKGVGNYEIFTTSVEAMDHACAAKDGAFS